jgi:predicted signal transduction protein with EAL and GGDEF domain/ActR/RegA family two-component response regulator
LFANKGSAFMTESRDDPLHKSTILLVDDNAMNIALLEAILKASGATDVTSCMDPLLVEGLLDQRDHDLILLDLRMPRRDGLEVLADIRARDEACGRRTPVIVLTAEHASDVRMRSLSAGADDYLTKPFAAEEVLHRIRNVLTRHFLLQERADLAQVLERQVAERTADLRRSERHLQSVMDTATEMIVTVDTASGQVTGMNRAACAQLQRFEEESLGLPISMFLAESAAAPTAGQQVLEGRRRDGSVFPWEVSAATTNDGATLVVTGRDISERFAAEQEIWFLAHHNTVTNLPNRRALRRTLTQALEEARGDLTVAFVEVAGLDEVGRAFGMEAMESALYLMGARLVAALPEAWSLASWGHDFVILAEGDQTGPQADLLDHLRALGEDALEVAGAEVTLTLTVGMAVAPRHGDEPLQLVRRASMAAFNAARGGRSHAVFDAALAEAMARRSLVLTALRHARERDELQLHFQPKVSCDTGQVVGAEALARWHNPDLGFVSPGEFIPLAEDSGLVEGIGRWALDAACAQAAQWCRIDPAFVMAVNISSHDLARPDFAAEVAACLARHALPAANLELEITETAVMKDRAVAGEVLQRLADLGLSVAIDDFGTGYSSLSYLSTLPATVLKVDQRFVRRLNSSENDRSIVRVIVGLARTLSMKTVAEGVETAEDAEVLRGLDCDLAQGYFFGRPCPPDAFRQAFLERPES